MKKSFFAAFLILMVWQSKLFAQAWVTKIEPEQNPYQNSIYLELLGNGIIGSVNYERLIPLAGPSKMIALRAGGIFIPGKMVDGKLNYNLFLPFEVTHIKGQKPLKLEVGFGITIWHSSNTNLKTDVITMKQEYITERSDLILPLVRIGGRWQRPGKPLVFRFALTPVLVTVGGHGVALPPVIPLPAASIGYSFGQKKTN